MTNNRLGGLAAAATMAVALLLGGGATAAPLKAGTVIKDCPTCTDMVVIPPGKVVMGSDLGEPDRNEMPLRPVTIGYSFLVATHSVTNAEFGKFIDATGYKPATDCILFVPVA